MSGLKVVQVGLVHADSFLKLLDVLSAALTECGLGLPVSLLTLLRCSVDLGWKCQQWYMAMACEVDLYGT